MDRVSNVHNHHPEWFDDPLVLSWDLSANRLLQKSNGVAQQRSIRHRVDTRPHRRVASPSTTSVAASRKGGYVGCATSNASVGGRRIGFKLPRGCRELTLRANLRAAPAAKHALAPSAVEPASRSIAQPHVNDATPSGTKARRRPGYPSRAKRRALRRPTATRMPKIMASGRGGQPGI